MMYEELLEKDEETINELWDLLLRFSYSYWPDNPTVDFFRQDYINEAVWKIVNNLHKFNGDSKFSSWAISVFKNLVLDELRLQRGNVTHNNEKCTKYIKLDDSKILVDQLFNMVVPSVVSEENFHMLIDYLALGRTAEEVCLDYDLANPNALYARVFRTKKSIVAAVGNTF